MATIVTRYVVGTGAVAAVEALLGCAAGATTFQTRSGSTIIHHDIVRLTSGVVVHSRYRSGTEDLAVLQAALAGVDSYTTGLANQAVKPTADWTNLTALRAAFTVLEGPSVDLPFNKTANSTLQAQTKKAWAHWHIFERNSFDQTPPADYWTVEWLKVSGESGVHSTYGGYCRQRSLPRNAIGSGSPQTIDYEKDIHQALNIGLDGFLYNMVDPNTANQDWLRFLKCLDAADGLVASTGFKIMLNIDANVIAGSNAATLATAFNTVKARSSYYTDSGTPVVTVFFAEGWTQAQWNTFQTNTSCKLVLVNNSYTSANWPTSGAFGSGVWGGGCPTDTNTSANCTTAKGLGKIWMDPIRPQDMRPVDPQYWEAKGSLLMRTMAARAISNDANWVQLVTWNDFRENSGFVPSSGTQYAYFDVAAYYIEWFKLGSAPTIVRDVLYYFHRIERLGVTYSTGLQTRGAIARSGSDAGIDQIECLSFLTATGDIEIDIGGSVTTFSGVSPGVSSNTVTLPVSASASTIVFRLKRSGTTIVSVTSPFPVYSSVTYQDFAYRGGSTSRPAVSTLATVSSNPA